MTDLVQHTFEGRQIRHQEAAPGDYWFVAKDVCEALGLSHVSKALNRIDLEDRNSIPVVNDVGHLQEMHVINESGLYALVLSSKKPEAKRFKRWVTSEVLPSLRKSGSYSIAQSRHLKIIPDASHVFTSLLPVAEAFGFAGNQAKLSAAKATRQVTGIDFQELLGVTHLIAESQTRHFTATELGARIGMSAIAFNRLLESRGLQEKIDGKWSMTARGRHLGVLLDTGKKHSNGTPVQQLKWLESVLAEIQEASA